MPDTYKNFISTTVATAPSPATSGTSLVVAAGYGANLPPAPFNMTVWPPGAQPSAANAEIVRVTAISTDTLTIARAQESTTARSILVGDQIAQTITAKAITDALTDGMTKAVYDPQNAGYISGANGTGTGGILNLDATLAGTSGSITTGAVGLANGGNIDTRSFSGTTGAGGDIITKGGGAGNGGAINTSNNGGSITTTGAASGPGGSINTAGVVTRAGGSITTTAGSAGAGGAINTAGGASADGGSITTSNGGGAINTTGTGSMQLGVAATRTTLVGTATAARSQSLPDKSGTVALTNDFVWVNFNGTANSNQAATYSRTGTTVTITLTAHGHIVGHVVNIDFTSGGALDGVYTIVSVPGPNTFTVTTAASGTIAAGSTLNLLRNTIRASNGVHSVTDVAAGNYRVNFTAAFSDANYVVTANCGNGNAGVLYWCSCPYSAVPTAESFSIGVASSTASIADAIYILATFLR